MNYRARLSLRRLTFRQSYSDTHGPIQSGDIHELENIVERVAVHGSGLSLFTNQAVENHHTASPDILQSRSEGSN